MNAPAALIRRDPHDPYRIRLGDTVGWEGFETAGSRDAVTVLRDTELVLSMKSHGTGVVLVDGPFFGLRIPPSFAVDPAFGVIHLDKSDGRFRVLDACNCRFIPAPCQPKDQHDRRALSAPHAITIGGGRLFVAEQRVTDRSDEHGNPLPDVAGRILALGLPDFGYRGSLRPADASPLATAFSPIDLAHICGIGLFVADSGSNSVHRFNERLEWVDAFPVQADLTGLAVTKSGRLVTAHGSEPAYRLYAAEGGPGMPLDLHEIADLLDEPAAPVVGRIVNLGQLCVRGEADDAFFDEHGDQVAPPVPQMPELETSGKLVLGPIDSRLGDCDWHALTLDADIPEGCGISIDTLTLEEKRPDDFVLALPETSWVGSPALDRSCRMQDEVVILSDPGRYLWLRIGLTGEGQATPTIRAIDLVYPRISLRRYLPNTFGRDPDSAKFTDRFLANFDRGFRQIEAQIDEQAALYDPGGSPATRPNPSAPDFLSWLASWIGVQFDAVQDENERRRLLKHSASSLRTRGTLVGLRDLLLVLLGYEPNSCEAKDESCLRGCDPASRPEQSSPPLVLEHFKLRRWLELGASRLSDNAILWGSKLIKRTRLAEEAPLGRTQLKSCTDPCLDPDNYYAGQLSVFLPACIAKNPARRAMFARVVDREIPAAVKADIVYVHPRFRIGIQSMIGFDAVVGAWPRQSGLDATLGRGTIIESDIADLAEPHGGHRLGHGQRMH